MSVPIILTATARTALEQIDAPNGSGLEPRAKVEEDLTARGWRLLPAVSKEEERSVDIAGAQLLYAGVLAQGGDEPPRFLIKHARAPRTGRDFQRFDEIWERGAAGGEPQIVRQARGMGSYASEVYQQAVRASRSSRRPAAPRHRSAADPLERWQLILDKREQLLDAVGRRVWFASVEVVDAENGILVFELEDASDAEGIVLREPRYLEISPGYTLKGRVEGVSDDGKRIELHVDRGDPEQARAARQRVLIADETARPGSLWIEKRVLRDTMQHRSIRGDLAALLREPAGARPPPAPLPSLLRPSPGLDENQRDLVRLALATPDILHVSGPPGTGKTRFVAETVAQYLWRNPTHRVLIASQTHVATDNALEAVLDRDPDARVVRVGDLERIREPLLPYALDAGSPRWVRDTSRRAQRYGNLLLHKLRLSAAERSRVHELARELDHPGRSPEGLEGFDSSHHRAELEAAIRAVWVQERWQEAHTELSTEDILRSASVVGGTCVGINRIRDTIISRPFHLVIVEEAGKANPTEALVPMSLGRRWILVGDSRQLPPFVENGLRSAVRASTRRTDSPKDGLQPSHLEETLFSILEGGLPSILSVRLEVQYRMLEAIGELVSRCFYQRTGGLRHGRSTPRVSSELRDQHPAVARWAGGAQVRWLDTAGAPEESSSVNWFNHHEVQLIGRELLRLDAAAEKEEEVLAATGVPATSFPPLSVALITPYAAQKRLLQNLALRLGDRCRRLEIEVQTVDSFQGRDSTVVLLSLVRSNRARRPGFLADNRRINVAVSRARDALLLVGDLAFCLEQRNRVGIRRVAEHVQHAALEDPDRVRIESNPAARER